MVDDPQDLAEMTDSDRLDEEDAMPADPDAVGRLAHDPGGDEATAWTDDDPEVDPELSAEEAAVHLTADPALGPSDGGYLGGER